MTEIRPEPSHEPDSTPGADAATPDLSLWTQLNVLLRQRRLLVALPVVVAAIAVIAAQTSPRQYLATTKFTPQELPSLGAGLGQLASQLGVTPGRVGTYSPQFYADLVLSREILRDAVRTQMRSPAKGFSGDLVEYWNVRGVDENDKIERAVRTLRGLLLTRADRNNLVSIELRMDDPDIALAVMKRLLELVNDFNLNRRQSQARAERQFVEERLATARASLRNAEDSIATFYRQNRVALAPELQAQAQRLNREVTIHQQLYLHLAQSFEGSRIEEVRSTPLITVLERPDGFVVKQSKRTIRNGTLAGVVALLVALALAFLRDGAGRSRQRAADDYKEFRRLFEEIKSELREFPRGWLRFGRDR